jgi:xanthine/uracil permease
MHVHIDLWAVLLSGVASMVIGMIYYADGLFGKDWKHLAKVNGKEFQKEMPKIMPGMFLGALVTAYTVAFMTFLYHAYFNNSWMASAVTTALILWLGLSATTTFIHNSAEMRSIKLTAITVGNRLLSILAMGLIIGWLHP